MNAIFPGVPDSSICMAQFYAISLHSRFRIFGVLKDIAPAIFSSYSSLLKIKMYFHLSGSCRKLENMNMKKLSGQLKKTLIFAKKIKAMLSLVLLCR